MAYLKKDNRLIASTPASNINHWLEENNENINDFEIELSDSEKKFLIRLQINEEVGDTDSILGTVNDTSHLLLNSFFLLVSKLEKAENLSHVRAAAQPFSEMAKGFLANIENGKTKLPYQEKGVDEVITKIETSATAIAEALESNTKGSN